MQLKYNEINKNQLISSETPFLENFQDCIKINKKNKISQSTLNCYERKPTKKEEDKFMSLTEYRKLK